MERLTICDGNEIYFNCEEKVDITEKEMKHLMLKRLARYEDAEEQGRLIVLPCKVGDTVWTNLAWSGWYFRKTDMPYKARVVFIGINGADKLGGGCFNVIYDKGEHMMQFDFSDIGKTVFLTREEAEKALEAKEKT